MDFQKEVIDRIGRYPEDSALIESAKDFVRKSTLPKYSYNFSFLGRPIIQFPQDIVAVQEIIWKVKPDLIIETGIAHGGSLILSASCLAQIELCEAIEKNELLDPSKPKRKVIGIDIDIRAHNKKAIKAHPMSSRIEMLEGSSIANEIFEQVKAMASGYHNVMVFLDSNHTHEHVLAELELYSELVTSGSYCVVFDTVIEELPEELLPKDRPWKNGDNSMTALKAFLSKNDQFYIDKNIDNKLLITMCPEGYLVRK